MKFKVGDRVRRIASGDSGLVKMYGEYTVLKLSLNGDLYFKDFGEGEGYWSKENFELIKNNKTIMKKLSNFYKKFTDDKVQSLVKAGYLNGDLEPTSKAEEAIKEIQFFAYQEELVKRAKAEIEEDEKNNT